MSHHPKPTLTGSLLTDSTTGTPSRTIPAAGAVYSQADENNVRASFIDLLNAARTSLIVMLGTQGGGYRRYTTPAALTINPTPTGTTIADAGAIYSQANENAYRADLATAINSLHTDMALIGFLTGRQVTTTHATDNSGGTASGTIVSASVAYSQATHNNVRASFAAKINAALTAIGA